MTKLCAQCPVNEVCLQAMQDKRCPIPTQPKGQKADKPTKRNKR